MRFVLRIVFNAIALALTTWILGAFDWAAGPSFFTINGFIAWLIIALIFGLVNALIRPIVAFLTCPLVILTLGLFTFVINALMLGLTSWLAQNVFGFNFYVQVPWGILLGALLLSLISAVASIFLPDDGDRG